jgi:methionyl-tRNA formyltransferase
MIHFSSFSDLVSSLSVVCPEEKISGSDAGLDSTKGILVRKWAMKNNVPIHTYVKDRIDPVVEAAAQNDVGVVVDFGYLIPRRLLDAFPSPPVLMHPSLLPKYRGAAPIEHAIMNGDLVSGVSVLTLHPSKFDAGQILAQKKLEMAPSETVKELRAKLSRLGAEAVADVLSGYDQLIRNSKPMASDKDAPPITAPKLKSNDYWPNWATESADNVYNRWRALLVLRGRLEATPAIVLQLDKNAPVGSTVMIHEVRSPQTTLKPAVIAENAQGLNAADSELRDLLTKQGPGCLFFDKSANLVWIQCAANSWVPVSKLQLPSRAVVDASSFLNGLKIRKPQAVAQLSLSDTNAQ